MSSVKLCWTYRATAATSGPKVGEKPSCNPRPMMVSSESFCSTADRRLNCCKRRARTPAEAALSHRKRRKLDGKRHTDVTEMDGWNKTYRLSRGESWMHSSAVKNRSDHLLPRAVMKVLYRDSSETTEVTTPRTVMTGFQGTGEKSRKLKLTNVREEPMSDVSEFHNQSIPNENLHGDIKINICETTVNDTNGLELSACKGNPSGIYSTADKLCDIVSSTHGDISGKSYTDSTHRSAFSGTSQHNTAQNQKLEDTVENKKLAQVNLKRMIRGSHGLGCGNDSKLKLGSASGSWLLVDGELGILCISGNVRRHLGYQQMDMMGHSIEDYIHPSDRPMVRKVLRVSRAFTTDEENIIPLWQTRRLVLNVAMRSRLQDTSASHPKEPNYTLVEWKVNLHFKKGPRGLRANRLIGLCRPAATASLLASRLDGNMFISRHDLNFRFTFCDHRLVSWTGYEPEDLIGWTPYHFISPWDATIFKQCLQALMCEGSSISRSYRFLTKAGVWVGMVTQATVVYDTRCKPRYIACKNHIVRDDRIQQKLNNEKEEFLKMKCLNICMKGDLPADKLMKTNPSVTNNQNVKTLCSDLFMKTLFDSDQQNDLVNPWRCSKVQDTLVTISSPGVITSFISSQPFFSKAVDSVQNVSQESIMNTISEYHISTNKLPLKSDSNSIQFEESIHTQQADAVSESMSSICEADLLDALVDSGQELTSQLILPLENTVDRMRFHQVFDCSTADDQCLLADTFPEPSWTPMEASELCDIQMADCESLTHPRNADQKCAESTADSKSQRVNKLTEDSKQARRSPEAYSALESAQVSDRLNYLCLPHTPLMSYDLPKDNILSPSNEDLQNITESNCHKSGHLLIDTSRHVLSSRLASLLQMELVPTSSSVYSLKEECVKHASELFQQEKKALSNAYLQSGVYSGNCQSNHSRTVSSGTDMSAGSMGRAQQISSANNISSSVSKLPILNHNFLPLSSIRVSTSDTCQADSNMLYNSRSDSENPSLCAPREPIFSDSDNINDQSNYCSIMTNRKYDPFLNQTSFKDLNPMICVDQTGDVSSLKCAGSSHFIMPQTSILEQDKQLDLEIDEIDDFSSCPDFVVSTPSISNAQFVSECLGAASLTSQRIDELDSFLGNTSSNFSLATNCPGTASCQAELFPEHLGFDSQVTADTSPCCGSNDSLESDNFIPTSLLRTLLDKEKKSIQEPLTCAEWICEQVMEKQSNIKTTKMSYPKTEDLRTDNRRAKSSRSIYRKSVNLPLPMSSHGVKVNFSKSSLPYRKPTKELPLPVSTKTTTQHLPRPSQTNNNNTDSVPQTNNGLNNDRIENNYHNSQEASNGFDLPDDLLDMAIEYCASMETDQEGALITDLTDNLLSEGHFNSPCGSPSQGLKSVNSSNTHKSGNLALSLPCSACCPSTESHAKASTSKTTSMQFLKFKCFHPPEPVSRLTFGSSQSNINTVNNLKPPQISHANSGTGRSKMSLLRTAVMTPDVDKLIKHIPLESPSKRSINNHDVLVPKCMKLREHSVLSPAQVSRGQVCQMPSVSTITSPETVSLFNPRKHDYNHRIALDHKATLDYISKTALSKDSVSRGQQLSNCLSSAASNGSPKPKSGSNPFVLKISIHEGCSPKVIISNKSHENSVNHRLKQMTPHTAARAAGWSVTDSSTTQPVSVIVMRKENNRTRRSKSIAVQTDHEPGEKYPEFERSLSDTFLYPSVIVCSPSSTASEECDMSPASTSQLSLSSSSSSPSSSSQSSLASISQASLANMSELEKVLCSHISGGISSPGEEGLGTLPNSSFLQRLLMGQLSKDQYQHLDKQMMEAEKRILIASGVV